MQQIETFTPAKAGSMALAFAAVKPKNLILTVNAAVAVAQTGAGAGQRAVALGVFIALTTLGTGGPLAIAVVLGERADAILGDVGTWTVRENSTIIAVVCLASAAKLVGDAITTLPG